MDPSFEYIFPAIRGIQAGREFYVSMCPLRLLPKIFTFDDEELIPELRAQRVLNKARIPEMARYIISNMNDYVFSAITASIDAKVRFEALGQSGEANRVGSLHIPMDARFIINDGQHRRAAIELALREKPDLADETIAVVFFLDKGLNRCQQMFADLNRYAIRPSKSLGILYDYRDDMALLAKSVVLKSPVFKDVVEMEKSTLSPRARKLFTLSSIYFATNELLESIDGSQEEKTNMAINYWVEVAKYIKEWNLVRARKMTSAEVRREFIHSHGIALQSIGKVGNHLLRNNPANWKRTLKKIENIDWSRSNSQLWEGRCMIGGRVSKSSHNVTLTTNAIKAALSLPLSSSETRVEEAYKRGDYEK
ncbi:DNA sulfur modification protein DndB [Desulfatibacillum aliphaticivorans]|uniref:DNA sulfur modification protein DndB n=1 Tax=Desulfatibacillum aliphaticivorans TaxID=218208 RepID=B8FD45_DESAL|nr:DNA sulfur modification protein DndB [Desulfatibacillum aliphaticivorans]ACL06476.1 DNA sulfur modification protein DndB [Desulfatibacillum aliphaticivorans]